MGLARSAAYLPALAALRGTLAVSASVPVERLLALRVLLPQHVYALAGRYHVPEKKLLFNYTEELAQALPLHREDR